MIRCDCFTQLSPLLAWKVNSTTGKVEIYSGMNLNFPEVNWIKTAKKVANILNLPESKVSIKNEKLVISKNDFDQALHRLSTKEKINQVAQLLKQFCSLPQNAKESALTSIQNKIPLKSFNSFRLIFQEPNVYLLKTSNSANGYGVIWNQNELTEAEIDYLADILSSDFQNRPHT